MLNAALIQMALDHIRAANAFVSQRMRSGGTGTDLIVPVPPFIVFHSHFVQTRALASVPAPVFSSGQVDLQAEGGIGLAGEVPQQRHLQLDRGRLL